MINKKPKYISNETLIDQIQKGDKRSLQLLIKRFHPKLVGTITYYTKNKTPVDDLAQECWYVIIEKLEKLDLKISFEAWALTIARRKSIDWIRKQQQMRKQAQEVKKEAASKSKDSDTNDMKIMLDKIHSGIQLLSPTQQIVMKLFYLENLSLREICNVLEIPEGTVKSRLFNARESLKEIIK